MGKEIKYSYKATFRLFQYQLHYTTLLSVSILANISSIYLPLVPFTNNSIVEP